MKNILIILFLTSSINIFSQINAFDKANDHYKKEKYDEAISLYQKHLISGHESSELYYNLGNCYFKKDDFAEAIWHYEKSLKLSKDQETIENLNLAKDKLKTVVNTLPPSFLDKIFYEIINLISFDQWRIITIIFPWLILFLYLIRSKIRKFYQAMQISLFAITLCLLTITYFSYHEVFKKEAIIFTNTSAKSEPTTNNKNKSLFSLPKGSKIEIIGKDGDWLKVKNEGNLKGWIKSKNCRFL